MTERERERTERVWQHCTERAPFKLCLAPAMPKPMPTSTLMPANARQNETKERARETAEADADVGAGSENRRFVAVCTVWLRFVYGK